MSNLLAIIGTHGATLIRLNTRATNVPPMATTATATGLRPKPPRNQSPKPQRNQAMQTATTLKPMPSATTPSPALQLTARRLVHLRNYPFNKANGQELTASEAFEYALRIVLDEHRITPGSDTWCALFYGKSQSCVNDTPDGWV